MNETNGTSTDEWNGQFHWSLVTSLIIFGALIFVFNVAVIVSYIFNKVTLLKEGTHVICLSISDSLTGFILCFLFSVTNRYIPTLLCDNLFLLYLASQSATGFQLLTISIERFQILRNIDTNVRVKTVRHSIAVIGIWALVVTLHLIPLITHRNALDIHAWGICKPGMLFGNTRNHAGALYSIVYVLPLIAVNVFYAVTMVILKRKLKTGESQIKDNSIELKEATNPRQKFIERRKKQQQQIFMTFFMVLLALDISAMPKILHFFFTGDDGEVNVHIRLSLHSLCSLNSLLNPLIYAFRWSEIRLNIFKH